MFQVNEIIELNNSSKYLIFYIFNEYLYLVNIDNEEDVMIVKNKNGELEEIVEHDKIVELLKKVNK